MTDDTDTQEEPRFEFTRRAFMEQSGLAGGALALAQFAVASANGQELGHEQWEPIEGDPGIDEEALVHFDVEQARLVQAMAARIMPSDEFGPGAVEAGVVYFIDEQLNGAWGHGDDFYMEPPFRNRAEGARPNQGYQTRLVPWEVYEFSIQWVDEYAQERYGSGFLDLSPERQDEVLLAVQNNEPDNFRSIEPEEFFEMLRQNTLEGMYCDPTYDGNRGMAGWRMKEFPGSPGALGSWRDLVEQEEFIRIPPRSVEDDVENVGVTTGTETAEADTAGAGGGNATAGGGNETAGSDGGNETAGSDGGNETADDGNATPEPGGTGAAGGSDTGSGPESHGSHSHGADRPPVDDDAVQPDPVPGHGPRWALDPEGESAGESAAANEDRAEDPSDRDDGGEE